MGSFVLYIEVAMHFCYFIESLNVLSPSIICSLNKKEDFA